MARWWHERQNSFPQEAGARRSTRIGRESVLHEQGHGALAELHDHRDMHADGGVRERCYFARGPSTWTPSLAKQHRLLNSLRAEPERLASSIANWATRLRLSFIRWCGGGDLVEETPACIDAVALLLPAVPQWVVSRKPEIAARIVPRPNVYLHLSVDRGSWARLDEFRTLAPAGLQWFWSYQCDRGELPTPGVAPVVFRDGYDLAGSEPVAGDCPLNLLESIVGTCELCRRCFNGDAVRKAADRGNGE